MKRLLRIYCKLRLREIRKRSKCPCVRLADDMTCLDCGRNIEAEAW